MGWGRVEKHSREWNIHILKINFKISHSKFKNIRTIKMCRPPLTTFEGAVLLVNAGPSVCSVSLTRATTSLEAVT